MPALKMSKKSRIMALVSGHQDAAGWLHIAYSSASIYKYENYGEIRTNPGIAAIYRLAEQDACRLHHPCDQYGRFAQVEETLSRTIEISRWCLGELYTYLGQPDARLLCVRRSQER